MNLNINHCQIELLRADITEREIVTVSVKRSAVDGVSAQIVDEKG